MSLKPRAALPAFLPLLCAAAISAAGEAPAATLQPIGAPKRLGGALGEISGLAAAGPDAVYAHNDETGTIYLVAAKNGRIERRMSIGRGLVAGDFEAVAVRGDGLFLITSKGVVYERETPKGRPATFAVRDLSLPKSCEVESLAAFGREFLIACKEAKQRLVVYEWRPPAAKAEKKPLIDVSLTDRVPNPKTFRAADLVYDPRSKTILTLDSSSGAILETTLKGERVGQWLLGGDHPQAEGLALMPDGRLIVADERGARGGTLTVYPPRRP